MSELTGCGSNVFIQTRKHTVFVSTDVLMAVVSWQNIAILLAG